MSARIMSLFGSLSSSNLDERVLAACSIVYHLTQVEPPPPHSSDPCLADFSNSNDLNYTLKRLVRGLASPTPGARLGFSIALCQIIQKFPQLSPLSIFDLIISATPLQSAMKASEERDSQFGRLFGIKCIAESGALFRDIETPQDSRDSAQHGNEQSTLLKKLLEELCDLARRAPWLSQGVGSVLVLDITMQILLHPKSTLAQSGALNQIAEMFLTNTEVLTLEKLALIILLQQHSVKFAWESILSKTFPNKQILSEANQEKLSAILMNIDGMPLSQLAQTGPTETDGKTLSSTPDLPTCPHFIHRILISASRSASNFTLSNFYNQLFERYYFAEKSSPSRRSHGFLILNNLLESDLIPCQEKPDFLTLNGVHTLQVQLAATDRLLHKMALSVASNVVSQVEQNKAAGSALAKGFASRIRALAPNFDHNCHQKLTRSLVFKMLSPELDLWTKELISAFQQGSPVWSGAQPVVDAPAEEEQDLQSSRELFREMMLTQLCSVINMNTPACTIGCATSILRCLTLCAFFGEVSCEKPKKYTTRSTNPAVPFSAHLRELCKARLYTCLLDLVERTRMQFFDKKKNQPKTAQATHPLHGFRPSQVILEIVTSHGSSQPAEALETLACIQSIRQNVKELRGRGANTESSKLHNKKEALVLLCDILYLMTYDDQDGWTEALPLIERLNKDVGTLLPPDGEFNHSQRLAPAMANLTECLLFLLSWPIALLRTVVEINFDSFSDCIGAQSLQLLIDHINPPESPLDDEDMDGASSGSEGANENEDSADEESSAEEDDDDDESDGDGETITDGESIDEEFRNDVAAALGNALSQAARSDDDSDDESELMNDDEMLALDANLAAIFKRRTGKKLTRMHNTQDLHLRMKILELIGKFVKLRPAPATLGRLIKPLLELIGKINPSEVAMKKKVMKILEDATRLTSTQSDRSLAGEPLSLAEISEIMTAVHLIAQTTQTADTGKSCGKCNLWLIEMVQCHTSSFVMESERQSALQILIKQHQDALKNFCSKRSSKLRPDFFSMIFKRFPAFGWLLRNEILDLSLDSSTLNAYRREQMLDLVSILINGYPPKNQCGPESVLQFDSYIRRLKEAILSQREVIATRKSADGPTKELLSGLKSLTALIKMMNSALRKRTKMEATNRSHWTIWSSHEIKTLSDFSAEIPASPQSPMIVKLMEGLTQFLQQNGVESAGVEQNKEPQKLKRKKGASHTTATEGGEEEDEGTPQVEKDSQEKEVEHKKKSKKNKKKKTSDVTE